MGERDIFIAALQEEDAVRRIAYLRTACGPDGALLERVEGLLRAYEGADRFLESPAPPPTLTVEPPGLSEGPGTAIGPYTLREQIGEGGMGTVYLADQTEPVRRKVALKVIKPGMDTKQVIARFEAERQALAMMDHPNIAKVHDGGATDSGRPYFVMELVRGLPITEYCDRERLSIPERLDLFVLVCRAVQHAHQKGVIHRDLKPSNILVTLIDGAAVPKVIYFGVAKATGGPLTDGTLFTGVAQMIGTPLYMSPEQADMTGEDVDTRSDIYALGVLLYELLTGTTPIDRETLGKAAFDEIRRVIRVDEPPKPSTRLGTLGETLATVSANRHADARGLGHAVRGELDWIVMKALEKDRRRRYETANDFAADVMRHLTDRPVEACSPGAWYRFGKFARRNRAALAVIASLAAALILTIAGLAVGLLAVAREQAKTAEAEGTVREALEVLEPGLRRGNPHAADVVRAARQAEAHLAGDLVRHELRGQARRLLADLTMLAELERIRLDQAAVKGGRFDIAGADSAYAAAFRSYGVDVEALGPAEAGARLRHRAIAEHLAGGLDNWAMARKKRGGNEDQGWRRLLEVAGEADPEPKAWRATFRGALAREARRDELEKLAGAAPIGELTATTLNLLGDLLRDGGAAETAVSVRRAGQQRYPADFWLNHYLAYDLAEELQPPQWDEAIGYFRAALALRPESPGVHLNLGNALKDKGRLDEAIACYEEALRLKPDYAGAHHNLGNLLPAKGRLDEAIASFREAIRLQPDNAMAHNGLGNLLRDLGRLDEAVASLREAIRLQPAEAAAHYNLGLTMLAQGHTDQAIACFHEALRIQPDHPNARIALGAALLQEDRRDEAIASFREAIRLQPDNAMAHNNLGAALKDKGRLDEAIAACREAIRLQPGYASPHANLGDLLNRQGKLDEAIAACRTALRFRPNFGCASSYLGVALLAKGELDQAVAAGKEAVRCGPAKHADHHVSLGNALAAKGELAEAIACHHEALRLKPDDASAHHGLAWLLATCPDPKVRDAPKAVALARRAVELAPQQKTSWNTLGAAHYRAGDWKATVAALEKSMEIDNGGDASRFFRAMAHWQLGDKEQARRWYDEAVAWMDENTPEDKEKRPQDEELNRFRAEAAELLGIGKGTAPAAELLPPPEPES